MKYIKNKHGRVIVVDGKRATSLLKEYGYSVATEEEALAWQEEHLKHVKKGKPTVEEESAAIVDELRADLTGKKKAEIIEFAASTYELELAETSTKAELIDQVIAFVRENEGI